MLNYIEFWFSKFLVDVMIATGMIGIILLIAVWNCLPGWVKQWRCKHQNGIHEIGHTCEARCNNCGMELGFIGTAREKYGQ